MARRVTTASKLKRLLIKEMSGNNEWQTAEELADILVPKIEAIFSDDEAKAKDVPTAKEVYLALALGPDERRSRSRMWRESGPVNSIWAVRHLNICRLFGINLPPPNPIDRPEPATLAPVRPHWNGERWVYPRGR